MSEAEIIIMSVCCGIQLALGIALHICIVLDRKKMKKKAIEIAKKMEEEFPYEFLK